ncbi:MAG: hypothetical protein Q7W55_06555 [Pseudohongiella sp.]|nr:hypothetical protein [Pseudohongiella sp.]
MNRRRIHRLTGIVLLLPFLAWSSTAVFFLVRPAYDQAYEQLRVRQLPVIGSLTLAPAAEWEEMRVFRTVLGNHLIVREAGRWQHLNADTLIPWAQPDASEMQRLLEDAFNANPTRYGRVLAMENNLALTDTGVQISINWDTMSLYQTGRDTYWINKVYDIHYLRWTGYRPFDNVFGLFGLFLLMYMTFSGARMAFGRR